MDHFGKLCVKEQSKGNWRPQNQMGGKTLLALDYADDLSTLDESVNKMNDFLEVSRVQGAKIGLKINVKKTKSLNLGISEDEKVTLGNEKISQVGSFIYLGSIINEDGGSSEDVKSRIAKTQGVLAQLKRFEIIGK